jgi:hypothetical protein
MLSREDNELLCHTGRGTPMGNRSSKVYLCRSGGVVLARDANWLEATRDLRRASGDARPAGALAAPAGGDE